MIKKIILVSLLGLFSLNANSQKNPKNPITTGIKAGLNLSNLSMGDNTQKIRPGFHVGGLIEIPMSYYKQFAFQIELQYSNQGYNGKDYEIIDKTSGKVIETNTQDDVTLHYINVPITFKYYFSNNFNIEVGPQLGFLVDAHGEFDLYKYNEAKQYLNMSTTGIEQELFNQGFRSRNYKDYYEKTDYGIVFGLSYVFDNGMFITGRYNLGLTDVYKADNGYSKITIPDGAPEQLVNQINELNKLLDFPTAKNSVFQFSVGYKF